jgi:type 1 glutamine amidotransferase
VDKLSDVVRLSANEVCKQSNFLRNSAWMAGWRRKFTEFRLQSVFATEIRSVTVSGMKSLVLGSRIVVGFVAALFATTFLSFNSAAADAPAKIKLLIIEGVSNHDWKHRLELVQKILAHDGSFAMDVSITPARADDPAWANWRPDFSKYDVVLSGYNNLGGKPGWPGEVRRAFETFVRNGGGFYVYHEANNAFAEWPEYNQMIGLGWRNKNFGSAIVVRPDESLQIIPAGEGGGTGHGSRADVTVHQLGEHPIHAGLPRAWKAAEIEVYRYARGPATNLTVLAYAADAQTQLQFPIEWTVQYGQGRVFVSTYGHVWADQKDPKGMKCAAFQTIMVRALKWLAKRPAGEVAPADFPTAEAISLRQ